MKRSMSIPTAVVLTLSVLTLGPSAFGDDKAAPAADEKVKVESNAPSPALLDPALATERAPDSFRVDLETTKGDVVILVNRSWAPNGADRFYNLVKIGYYDDVAFYRVIRGFMAQCGFNGDPAVSAAWSKARIADDPVTQSNTRGMVTFAQPSAPNARTTQFFVNFGDNSYLKQHGAFAPFGKVISGMDVMDSIFAGYGDGAPNGNGPSQATIAREGNSYLKQNFPKLDYIKRATIVEAPE
jgi:peptidyl-prolyl cis-trans isomerase A (cyclophilin A)